MIGPQKVSKAVIALDASYSLQKLPESKHKPVNQFLAKGNHHTSLSVRTFQEMQFFSQVKDQKSNKLVSPAGPWKLATDDSLQRTWNTSPAHWPKAQAIKPDRSFIKRDTGLRHKQAVLSANILIFISFPQKIQKCRGNTHCEQVLKNRILIKIKSWETDVSNNVEHQEYPCCFK